MIVICDVLMFLSIYVVTVVDGIRKGFFFFLHCFYLKKIEILISVFYIGAFSFFVQCYLLFYTGLSYI